MDTYTIAFNSVVQDFSRNVPEYFVSNLIFADDYLAQVRQLQDKK